MGKENNPGLVIKHLFFFARFHFENILSEHSLIETNYYCLKISRQILIVYSVLEANKEPSDTLRANLKKFTTQLSYWVKMEVLNNVLLHSTDAQFQVTISSIN